MNVAAMVEEVARAVSVTVSRSIAPIQRQIDDLIAWRKAVGEIRNGVDGAKGEPGVAGKDGAPGINGKDAPPVDIEQVVSKVLALVPTPKDGARGSDGRDGRDGTDGKDGAKGEPGLNGKDGADGINGRDGADGARGADGLPGEIGPAGKDGKDGKDGERGERGEPGLNGKDGRDGLNGKDGADGLNGKDGRDGIDGKDGSNGLNGKDGNGIVRLDHDIVKNALDVVMDNGDIYTLSLPVPQRGERGEKGESGLSGKDGRDGIDGKNGADGLNGKDGAPGQRGEKGDVASPDDIAAAVTKACESLLPTLVAKQYETSMPEIIARASMLVPPGRDGLPGRPGTPGEDGRDGVSIEGFEFKQADRRTQICVMKMTDGSQYEWPIKMEGMVIDCDVHRPGAVYEKGDAVTHGGSYWIARKDTSATPGKSDDWRLAVKRGRDGKDAVEDSE